MNGVDAIVHLAAKVHDQSSANYDEYYEVNVTMTEILANLAANASVNKFIYLSSLKVVGEVCRSGEQITEKTPPSPKGAYAKSKLEAEGKLIGISKESNLSYTIIRPPLVYGKGVGANFSKLVKFIKKYRILPFGAFKNKRSFVAIDNLVNMIGKCLIDERSHNKIFYVSDDRDITFYELVNLISRALNKRVVNVFIPMSIFKLFSFLSGRSELFEKISTTLTVNIDYTKRTLDWTPITSLDLTLKDMLSE